MKIDKSSMLLYAVTDRAWTGEKTLKEQIEESLKGGVTCLQLREKEMDRVAFLAEAEEIKRLCAQYGVPLIINDAVDIAVKSGADGVHIGQSDMDAAEARALLGEDKILGVSARTVEQAKKAERDGADYLGVGAVFPTSTKTDASAVSHEVLAEICAAVKIPVVAIGGINTDNIERLAGTGICGVALVSAIYAAEDIEGRCRQLLSLSEKAVRS